MSKQVGRKPKNLGSRTTFMFSPPSKEVAAQVEELVRECDMSANAVLTALVEYALPHVRLKSRSVKTIAFDE